MAAFGTIYLDTNIFVMAFETRNETSELLTRIFENADLHPETFFVTSELTLSELLVRPIRDGDDIIVAQYEAAAAPSALLNVTSVTRSVLLPAAALRAQDLGIKLQDAIHVATAMVANCSHILTNDYGIKGTYSAPAGAKAMQQGFAPLVILRPDHPTLTSLLQSLAA